MLTDFYRSHKQLILIVLPVLVLAFIALAVYYNIFLFHVTSVTPNPNSASYLSPKLVVDFNKELSTSNIKVSVEGSTVTSTAKGKELTIELPTLMGDQKYTVTIESIESQSGDKIINHSITLQTVLNEDSMTPADLKQVLDEQQANKPAIINDPVLAYLPHSTLDYTIDSRIDTSTTGVSTVVITVDLLLTAADENIGRDAAIAQYKQEALDYLSSLKGVDISKYSIEYTVTDSTE